MSGFITPDPDNMTVFECRSCNLGWGVQNSDLEAGVIDSFDLTHWHVRNGVPTRCLPCIMVLGAIDKMRNMVFQNPWLATEGMAGKPKKQAWELAEDTATNKPADSGIASACSSNGDGRTLKESEKFRDEMAKSFAASGGKGMSEDEALELGDEEKKDEKNE